MRVLWLNWRDIKNPSAGGAELFTHEVAKRLVQVGCSVRVFTSTFPGAKLNENFEGVEITRRGGRKSVYIQAARFYKEQARTGVHYDVVIDAINTIPFFTPLYARSSQLVTLIFQLTGRIFLRELPLVIGPPLYALERSWYKFLYSRIDGPVLVLSQSVKQELAKLGFDSRKIHVAEPGVDCEVYSPGLKGSQPTVLYLNRVVPYKNVHHLVRAFAIVRKRVPEARLQVVGCRDREYKSELVDLARELELGDFIEFYPFASGVVKVEFLRRAWVHVLPSTKEGWGISALEAAACSTPTVAYDVVGMRDSVRNGETGLLVPFGSIDLLAGSIIRILEDVHIRNLMGTQARDYASEFSWKKTTEKVLTALRFSSQNQSTGPSISRGKDVPHLGRHEPKIAAYARHAFTRTHFKETPLLNRFGPDVRAFIEKSQHHRRLAFARAC